MRLPGRKRRQELPAGDAAALARFRDDVHACYYWSLLASNKSERLQMQAAMLALDEEELNEHLGAALAETRRLADQAKAFGASQRLSEEILRSQALTNLLTLAAQVNGQRLGEWTEEGIVYVRPNPSDLAPPPLTSLKAEAPLGAAAELDPEPPSLRL